MSEASAPQLDRAALKLPPEDGDAALHEVSRDGLSVFLYLSFTDKELGDLFQKLRLSIPGFRIDKLSGVQKADHLADEIRERPEARAAVVELLREIYEFPALDDVALSPEVALRLAVTAELEDFRVLVLWRLLSDPQPEVRKQAHPSLDLLAKAYYGGSGAAPPVAKNTPKPSNEPREGADLEKELARAKDLAEKANKRADEIAVQLKAARQDEAEANKELSKARKTIDRQGNEISQLKLELDKARARAKAKMSEKQLRELDHAKEQAQKLEAELEALKQQQQQAKPEPAPAPVVPAAPASDEESDVVEEAPRDWKMPRFTNEFYDSLSGWDLRLQRAAFKQAYLLAENYRHPSLRALPLQGLEGYYRVRVATDVRLIYRRNTDDSVDILSLIDREDLDRYVRQAKAR